LVFSPIPPVLGLEFEAV